MKPALSILLLIFALIHLSNVKASKSALPFRKYFTAISLTNENGSIFDCSTDNSDENSSNNDCSVNAGVEESTEQSTGSLEKSGEKNKGLGKNKRRKQKKLEKEQMREQDSNKNEKQEESTLSGSCPEENQSIIEQNMVGNISSSSNNTTDTKSNDEYKTDDVRLLVEQREIFNKASVFESLPPSSFTFGNISSVFGLDSELELMIAGEEEEISKLHGGLVVYNVSINSETKSLLLEIDETVESDKLYTSQVITSAKEVGINQLCPKVLVKTAGSLLVDFQGKNDILYAKILLIRKLLNKIHYDKNLSRESIQEIQNFKNALAIHEETITARHSLIIDIASILLACQKKSYIPKQIVCTPTRYYLPNPKQCTTEDLVNLMEKMIFFSTMRFTENSHLQTCSDRFPRCKKNCSSGDALCLNCFVTSLCKKVHLFRKHYYGKRLVETANKAYECETFLYFDLRDKAKKSVLT